ncbi:hypothetical protein [Actinoplanes sp. NPDC026623]|jgi:hypothetical protein|uniref:hypothetical protein n=1 Tax=Actinoplanes sp. NPDC026623 TaxID=3155610 RepID=UPI00340E2D70
MVAALVRIAPLASAGPMEPTEMRDLVYTNAAPEDGIEHVRARHGPHGIDIVAFLDGDDAAAAADRLRGLVEKTIHATAALRNWHVI